MKLKIIKPLFFLFIIAALCLSMAGCGILGIFKDSRKDDIRYAVSERFVREAIFDALDNGDAGAIKALFSNAALAQAPNIDEKLEEYVDFYNGAFVEYRSKSGSESGLPTYRFNHWYIITTTTDEFVIFFEYITRDNAFEAENKTDVSDEIGLHQLVILRKELADEIRGNPWPHSDGVFILYSIEDYPMD